MDVLLLFLVLLSALLGLLVRYTRLVARGQALGARLLAGYQRVHAQLLARYETADGYLKFASKSLAGAVLIFLVLPAVLRIFYPTAGGFDQGTINTLALAALQYFAAAHLALYTYKRLLPSFYEYLVDTIQDKVLENLTGELETHLTHPEMLDAGLLPALSEHRKLLEFKFSIRCKRLLFCLLPLAFFYLGAQLALTVALTVVPH